MLLIRVWAASQEFILSLKKTGAALTRAYTVYMFGPYPSIPRSDAHLQSNKVRCLKHRPLWTLGHTMAIESSYAKIKKFRNETVFTVC